MGGHLYVHNFSVVEETVGYGAPPKISLRLQKSLTQKYGLSSFPWSIDHENNPGLIYYEGSEGPFKVSGMDVDIFAMMILELAHKLKRNISGSFSYTSDLGGGTYFGVGYIFSKTNTANLIEYEAKSHPDKKDLTPINREINFG